MLIAEVVLLVSIAVLKLQFQLSVQEVSTVQLFRFHPLHAQSALLALVKVSLNFLIAPIALEEDIAQFWVQLT